MPGPTIQDVLDRIDTLETTLLARFTNLDTAVSNLTTEIAILEAKIDNIYNIVNLVAYDVGMLRQEHIGINTKIDEINTKLPEAKTG